MRSKCIVCLVDFEESLNFKNNTKDIGKVFNEIFTTFSKYFSLTVDVNYSFNFQQDMIPFCTNCRNYIAKLCVLDKKIEFFHKKILQIIARITQQIFNCEKQQLDGKWNSKKAQRIKKIVNLRKQIISLYNPRLILKDCKKYKDVPQKIPFPPLSHSQKSPTRNVGNFSSVEPAKLNVKNQNTPKWENDDCQLMDVEDYYEDHHPEGEREEYKVISVEKSSNLMERIRSKLFEPTIEEDDNDVEYLFVGMPAASDDDHNPSDSELADQLLTNRRKRTRTRKRIGKYKTSTGEKKIKVNEGNDEDARKKRRQILHCKRCWVTITYQELKLHNLKEHSDYANENLTCPICQENQNENGTQENQTENGTQAEIPTKTENNMKRESFCVSSLVQHISTVHSDKKALLSGILKVDDLKFLYQRTWLFEEQGDGLKCLSCGAITIGLGHEQMIDHLKTQHIHPSLFVCETCGKSLSTNHAYRTHMVSHSTETPYICEICGGAFKSSERLKVHQKNCHVDTLNFKCDHCEKRFKTKRLLIQHIGSGTHSGKKAECTQCDKTFISVYSLKRHVKYCHEGKERARNCPCPECGKTFFTRSEVAQHLIRCPNLVGPRKRRTFPKSKSKTDSFHQDDEHAPMDTTTTNSNSHSEYLEGQVYNSFEYHSSNHLPGEIHS